MNHRESRESKGRRFSSIAPSREKTLDAVPPQYPTKNYLDRISEFMTVFPCGETRKLMVIDPFVPEARPGQISLNMPGRIPDDPATKDKKMKFTRRLFEPVTTPRRNRFSNLPITEPNSMAFLFPPMKDEAPESIRTIKSSCLSDDSL